MAFTLSDRVRETSTTTGTGSYTLAGAVDGFRTFLNGVGNANQTIYVATMGTQWEVGLGTASSTGPTLTRDSVRASSNAGAAVNWTAGTKEIRGDADAFYLLSAKPILFGPTATTSGTVFSFTTVPADATKLEIYVDGFKTNGGSDIIMTLGGSGGLETSGYLGNVQTVGDTTVENVPYSSSFVLVSDQRATLLRGTIVLDRIDGAAHRWMISGNLAYPSLLNMSMSGTKTLSSTITQYQITTVSANTFTDGAISTRIWT